MFLRKRIPSWVRFFKRNIQIKEEREEKELFLFDCENK